MAAVTGNKRPESVLVVIFTAGGEALLLKRADHRAFWQSVTGSLEWDEADRLAVAKREVFEETGIVVVDGWRDWERQHRFEIYPEWRHRYPAGVTHNTEHVLSLELPARVNVHLHACEHEEYRWVHFPEAIAQATSGTNRWALKTLQDERGFH